MEKNKVIGLIVACLGVLIVLSTVVISTGNQSVRLVNEIKTAEANISKEQNRRVKLFGNLVDAVKDYNDYESGTMEKITDARVTAENGDVESAKSTINAVAESYPDLKSQSNYKKAMDEFTNTENRLANYVESYNNTILTYNNFSQTFPNSLFLKIMGHKHQDFKQSELDVVPESVDNIFSK